MEATKSWITARFAEVGCGVFRIVMPPMREGSKTRHAFVQVRAEQVAEAISALNGRDVDGRQLEVKQAPERNPLR